MTTEELLVCDDDGIPFEDQDNTKPNAAPVGSRKVIVCGVPHDMAIVEDGVLFCDRAGFWGVVRRTMFDYREGLWYLLETTRDVPVAHIVKMHALLAEHIGADHEVSLLQWRQ